MMIMMMIHHVLYEKNMYFNSIYPIQSAPQEKIHPSNRKKTLSGHLGHRIDVEIEDRAIWAW